MVESIISEIKDYIKKINISKIIPKYGSTVEL